MSRKTGRREFIEATGLAVTGIVAASQPLTGSVSQPQQQPAPAAGTMGARFRRLIERSEPFENIAVFDVMTARMSEMLGFPSLSIGGSAVDEFHGVPGYGLTAGAYKIDFGRRIANSVDIPVMIDIADDAPTPLILYRDVGEFERAGLGAIHMVDGRSTGGGGFFSESEMVDRIRAAADARSDLVISVRCQRTEDLQQAIDRGAAYAKAGADVLWFQRVSFNDLPRVAAAVRVPLMGRMVSTTPVTDARAARITLMWYPALVQNIAQGAVYDALMELKQTGLMRTSARGTELGDTLPADFRNRLRRTDDYLKRAARYNMKL
jgi:methylisocitrate lyase